MDRWKNRNLLNKRDAFALRQELELMRNQASENRKEIVHKLDEMQEILKVVLEKNRENQNICESTERLMKILMLDSLSKEVENGKCHE